MIQIKRPVRFIQAGAATNQKLAQEKYYNNLVVTNPHFRVIIGSLKSGVNASQIASHCAREGWITVNERTFAEAIRLFVKRNPDAISNSQDADGLDGLVEPNQPYADTLRAAKQLLKIQQMRLAITIKSEKTFGMLLTSTPKEMEVTNKMLETIAKMEGRIVEGGKGAPVHEESHVAEDLGRVKKDQSNRDRLHSLVKQVMEVKG